MSRESYFPTLLISQILEIAYSYYPSDTPIKTPLNIDRKQPL